VFRQNQKEAMKSLIFFQGEQEENAKVLQQYVDNESEQQGTSEKPATLKVNIDFSLVFTYLFRR
jgi:hypothetical protein